MHLHEVPDYLQDYGPIVISLASLWVALSSYQRNRPRVRAAAMVKQSVGATSTAYEIHLFIANVGLQPTTISEVTLLISNMRTLQLVENAFGDLCVHLRAGESAESSVTLLFPEEQRTQQTVGPSLKWWRRRRPGSSIWYPRGYLRVRDVWDPAGIDVELRNPFPKGDVS